LHPAARPVINNDFYREVVFPGKFKIALVVGRHGHHRARPVFHKDIIGHPQRDLFVIDGIDDISPAKDPFFLRI